VPFAPQTDQWGSRLGFILPSVGAAVGLGNLWRFPSVAAENGGGAFVLLFFVVILVVGAPAIMAELALGRHTGRNPVDAFLALRPRSPWGLVGALGVLASLVTSPPTPRFMNGLASPPSTGRWKNRRFRRHSACRTGRSG
jgi:SNF family Na+-dependent transporter